ncbi:MAG TPA: VWA domain-containing protein [Candidatus Limnocylindrales bacterium]|nr:VWA domain-containing protein [Candidatus Limnocylindrales bacterium]
MSIARFEYSAWDGTQRLALDADDILDQLADRLIDGDDPRWALQRMMREGLQRPDGQRMQGLREMLERIKQARQERLEKHDLGQVVDQLREALDKIVQRERDTVERRLAESRGQPPPPTADQQPDPADSAPQDAAPSDSSDSDPSDSADRPSTLNPQPSTGSPGEPPPPELLKALERIASQHKDKLDELPDRTGQRLKALQEYDFMDPQAAADFKELMERLKQSMLGSFFKDLKQSIQNLTPEALAAVREMVRDLNKLLQEHMAGQNPDASEFLQKHGQFFPGAENLQDILDQLAQQMNQMGSLMRSLSSAQRQELADMLSAALGDDRLRVDLAQLAGNLSRLIPPGAQRYPFGGDEPLGLEEALDLMGEMEGIDRSDEQMQRAMRDPRALSQVDAEALRKFVGDDVGQNFEELREISKILKDAGYLEERGGELKLTGRAIRKIGDKALRDIFSQLHRDRAGRHDTERRGSRGERSDDSKPYEFGDTFHLDLRETLMNAVVREGPGTPVHLEPADFQVFRTDHSTRAATVLLIDMSRSMIYNGCSRAAKRLALALQSLIRGQYPNDAFHVVAFAAMAREIAPNDVAHLFWNEDNQGTNLQHGLAIARQLLGRYPGANRQAIVVTDGEPTAHLLDSGEPFFMHPTHPETARLTLREALRCSRDGIRINTFMIEGGPALEDFVGEMTGLVRGRAFVTDPNRLGEYVLLDYVKQRRRRVA